MFTIFLGFSSANWRNSLQMEPEATLPCSRMDAEFEIQPVNLVKESRIKLLPSCLAGSKDLIGSL